jgi:hypothetical protein
MTSVFEEWIPKRNILLCFLFFWAKGLSAKDSHKEMFPVYGGKYLLQKAVHNWVEKFSQGRSRDSDDARPGHPAQIATEVLIRADRRAMIDSVTTALWCSYGLTQSTMHYSFKFQNVCTRRMPQKTEGLRKKWTKWVCARNISYCMQTKKKIYLTGLFLGTNHGCITTNPNQSVLQWNENITAHIFVQPRSSRLCLPCFGTLWEYC